MKNSPMNYISIGLQLSITIFIFMYAGHLLDAKYTETPIFTLLGAFIGMIIGFYHLIKLLKVKKSDEPKLPKDENDENDKDNKNNDDEEKVKWR